MRLGIEMGNPESLRWERFGTVDLVAYSDRSSASVGDLPSLPNFVVEYAVERFELDIHAQTTVLLYVFYSQSANMVSLMVNHQRQRIAQAMGVAFADDGSGMTLMFGAPGTTVPVNIVCQP
jgi:hypothetical protein